MEEPADNKEKNEELFEVLTLFKEIFSKAPPILKDLSSDCIDIDFKECVDDHIDFKQINEKFKNEKYSSVTDAVTDIRRVFLNCYKFYGTRSNYTLESLKIEELFEQKISCLDENLKQLANVKLTFDMLNMDGKPISKFSYPKNCYDSVLLRCVAHCRPERLKEYHKIFSTTLTTDEANARTLEELMSWENEIYFSDNYRNISSMWELPEIGNFVAIIFKEFGFDIVNQGEIERMFLMPKESQTMGKILTTLLMPFKKNKCSEEILPYQIWSEKLNVKVSEWFKMYHHGKKNKVRMLELLGIHPDFWAVIGDTNPLDEYDYCELPYFIKVWLVKGLCDYITVKYKTINEVILNCNERQCTIWKNDLGTEEYFYFNSMPDLRVYYYNIPDDEPSLEFLETEKGDEEKIVGDENDDLLIPSISNVFRTKSRVKPNDKNFKLIADSVQGLRSFLDELGTEDTSVPENLISAFEDLIDKLEPEECSYIVRNNDSKIKLFEDWKSYLERSINDKNHLLIWKEKKSKSSEDLNGEIILEKRKRKPVLMHDFNQEYLISGDFNSESSENVSDLSDSEDEWGALNQSKNKTKQQIQAPSKVIELEKRLKVENKMIKQINKKSFNCNIKDKPCKTASDSDHVEKYENEENEHNTNLLDYSCSEKLVCSEDVNTAQIQSKNIKEKNTGDAVVDFNKESDCFTNIDTTKIEITKVSCDDDIVFIENEKEENKNPLPTLSKKQKYVENNIVTNEQPVPICFINLDLVNTVQIESEKIKEENNVKNTSDAVVDNFNKESECFTNIDVAIDVQIESENKIEENNVKNTSDAVVDDFNKESDCFTNIDTINVDITKVSCDNDIVFIENEKELNKNPLPTLGIKRKYVENNIVTNEQPVPKQIKTAISSKDVEIVDIDNTLWETAQRENSSEIIVLDSLTEESGDINDQNKCTKDKSPELKSNDEIISIEDDDEQIVISDDEDIQIISMTQVARNLPIKINGVCSLRNNINKSQNLVSKQRQMATTNRIPTTNHIPTTSIPKLSPNISIMPANVHLPKGIQVTMINKPQTIIPSHFNSTKRSITKKPSTVDVECRVISKPNVNGEVKFYVNLPNGKLHPVSDELMNKYLKDNNNVLPDYWLVPLPVEVAKQYGFN